MTDGKPENGGLANGCRRWAAEGTDGSANGRFGRGLRPVEVWLPDIWSDEVWEQVYRDCELIRASEEEADVDLWVEVGCHGSDALADEIEEKEQ